ncbi:MAG: tRNA lysidine(34) synthetase TilS [Thermogemmatispora sp.]|uniref:tRNA lysidine(34) synthetase TilS n=1 Tax=Thermogemmatispora sp. TaxID=1968838 RepID=UPI001A0AB61A|nr:tRNA lysidine(34) synthetase TilS [Thermogemmatispora sp.]MBE3564246.1 tRNA lysidine(34) synthetase TilS [Thermogemmatispora sp.]
MVSAPASSEWLTARVAAYIARHGLLPPQSEIVVAVSGGADSLCLLHLLRSLCGEGRPFPTVRLFAAHLNHRLRGQASERDALHVARLVSAWGIPLTIGSVDVPALARREKRSLEEAARLARYAFLRDVARGRLIAVAHQADDQVETILLHLLRGSGLAGLVGMAPRQQDIIRPLLEVSRAEILAYCQQQGLKPLEDESNRDPRFLRNRVRHELLPLLEQLNPGIRETLRRSAEVLRVDLEWIESCVSQSWSAVVTGASAEEVVMTLPALLAQPLSLQRHLLRRATALLCGGQSPLEPRHYALLEAFLQQAQRSRAERSLDLPGRLQLQVSGSTLRLFHGPQSRQARDTALDDEMLLLPVPGEGQVPGTPWRARATLLAPDVEQAALEALAREDWEALWHLLPRTRYVVYIDGEAAGPLLQVRTRRAGDRIQPLGMQQSRKVQDVLVDAHVPRSERDTLPLFFAGSRCIWIAGHCLAESVRLSRTTRRIVQLSISR